MPQQQAPRLFPWQPPRDLSTPEGREAWAIHCSRLQQLASGTADAETQKAVLAFVIEELCATYDISFRPDQQGGERATTFAEGKRFVGTQLVTMLKTHPPSVLQRQSTVQNPRRPSNVSQGPAPSPTPR